MAAGPQVHPYPPTRRVGHVTWARLSVRQPSVKWFRKQEATFQLLLLPPALSRQRQPGLENLLESQSLTVLSSPTGLLWGEMGQTRESPDKALRAG